MLQTFTKMVLTNNGKLPPLAARRVQLPFYDRLGSVYYLIYVKKNRKFQSFS